MGIEIGNIYQESELHILLNRAQSEIGNNFLLNLVAGVGNTPCHQKMMVVEYLEEMICNNECGFKPCKEQTIRDILTIISE